MTTAKTTKTERLEIKPPRMERAAIKIIGTAPLVIHRFSEKSRKKMEASMEEGSQRAKNKKAREPRDFEADYQAAMYQSDDGWHGFPASMTRNALISSCRLVGFPMTRAKLSIFVIADGFDATEGVPLVRIHNSEPEMWKSHVRNSNGEADVRARPMYRAGWEAILSLEWDGDQFGASDVLNLAARAGLQGGIGEGRPDSPKSNGLGYGTWRLVDGVAEMSERGI
jgi:hypothetical protein